MSLLSKGSPSILLGKSSDELGVVSFGLGWDTSHWVLDADVDASALYVIGDPNRPDQLRAADPNNPLACLFFHKNTRSGDGAVVHFGDNRSGRGHGIDERINVDTRRVPMHVNGVIAFVNIHDGTAKNQELNELRNAFFRVESSNGRTLVQRDIDAEFPQMRSACVGGVFRDHNGGWSARYLSIGSYGELATLLPTFGLNVG